MPRRVKLDKPAVRRHVLIDLSRDMVEQVTHEIAGRAGAEEVEFLTTDRYVGRVHVLPFDQAARGKLTRAAASLGLEVKPPKKKKAPRR